jgi:hypothetical protein
MKDKSKLVVGIIFIMGSAYYLVDLLTREMKSFYITGIITCAILGVAFIKSSRH